MLSKCHKLKQKKKKKANEREGESETATTKSCPQLLTICTLVKKNDDNADPIVILRRTLDAYNLKTRKHTKKTTYFSNAGED